jgi:hypothetical protein
MAGQGGCFLQTLRGLQDPKGSIRRKGGAREEKDLAGLSAGKALLSESLEAAEPPPPLLSLGTEGYWLVPPEVVK